MQHVDNASASFFFHGFLLWSEKQRNLWHIILMFIVFYCQTNYFWYCAAGEPRIDSYIDGKGAGSRSEKWFSCQRGIHPETHTHRVIWLACSSQTGKSRKNTINIKKNSDKYQQKSKQFNAWIKNNFFLMARTGERWVYP